MTRKPRKARSRGKPTLAKLKKRAWALLSELVRRTSADQDGGCTCYTCGAWHLWNSGLRGMHAGHAIPGREGAVLFDEELVRPQCAECNAKPPYGRGGEHQLFVSRLLRERHAKTCDSIGCSNVLSWWEGKLSASRQVRKWSRVELMELIESYKVRLVALSGS
jgi:hypothetical protein